MNSTASYKEVCELVMVSKEVCLAVNCVDLQRAKKAISKTKNEAGVDDWRYFKLRYRVVTTVDGCELCISKYRVFKSKLVLS